MAARKTLVGLFLLSGALAFVAVACGGGTTTTTTPSAEGGHDETGEMVEIPPDAQKIEVVGTEFAFDPADFGVEAGRPVAVTFVNEGAVEHDWALRTMEGQEIEGAHVHAMPGEEAAAVFTLEPGTYEAWCTLPGHYEGGMKGTVTAE